MPKKRIKSRRFGIRGLPGFCFWEALINCFWEIFGALGIFLGVSLKVGKRGKKVRRKSYKGRCTKRMLRKSTEVARLYDVIQSKYADIQENCDEVKKSAVMFCLTACVRESILPILSA